MQHRRTTELPWPNWIRRLPTEQEIVSSSLIGSALQLECTTNILFFLQLGRLKLTFRLAAGGLEHDELSRRIEESFQPSSFLGNCFIESAFFLMII